MDPTLGKKMYRIQIRLMAITLTGLAGAGCAPSPGQTDGNASGAPLIMCKDPRPEICTQHYDPVCGSLGKGEFKTYGNACTACSKAAVIGYRHGACK
jgi:hypothetical protein